MIIHSMDVAKNYFYKYWIEGSIKDASITKIYQDNKLIYDSTKDTKPPFSIIIDNDNIKNMVKDEDQLSKKLKKLKI